MRRAVALVLVSLVVCPTLASADDLPITGAKLQLKQSGSGKQKLVFQSKDRAFPFPDIGGSADKGHDHHSERSRQPEPAAGHAGGNEPTQGHQ